MTRLRLVGKGRISAWPPPFSAQVSVETVETIKSMSESKSAFAPPPMPPGPAPIGTVEGDMPFGCWRRAELLRQNLAVGAGGRLLAAVVDQHGRAGVADADMAASGRRPSTSLISPCKPMLLLGTKFGIGVTRSATLYGRVIDFAVAKLLAGDLQHFVVDHVAQVERLQDQVQRALERDFLAEIDRDRRVAVDAFLGQAARIEMDVDAGQLRKVAHHFAERSFLVAQQHRRLQPALDFQLALGAALNAVLGAFAVLDEVVPILLVVDQLIAVVGDRVHGRFLDGVELLPEAALSLSSAS